MYCTAVHLRFPPYIWFMAYHSNHLADYNKLVCVPSDISDNLAIGILPSIHLDDSDAFNHLAHDLDTLIGQPRSF